MYRPFPLAFFLYFVASTSCLTTPEIDGTAQPDADIDAGKDATSGDATRDSQSDVRTEPDLERLTPLDWRSTINVWDFEGITPKTSSDEIEMVGTPPVSNFPKNRGDKALSLAPDQNWSASDASFGDHTIIALTVGGWFRFSPNPTARPTAVSRFANLMGWGLGRDATNLAVCGTNDGITYSQVVSMTEVTNDRWHHIICVFNMGETSIYVDGVRENVGSATFVSSRTPLKFGEDTGDFEFLGAMDDVIVEERELPPQIIRRIYACGVDGTDCRCKESNPTEYEECGRLGKDCGNLPDCNADLFLP